MSDPKVKKALKDLALPIKSAVTKTALLLADSIRKANNEAAKAEARKELSVTYQEKDIVWEGGVMPLLAATLGQAKDKLMLESLSLCFALAVENCLPNVNALEKTDVEKHLVELSSNSSLIVQTFASLAISHMCKLGSSTSRMKFIAAGAVRNLTNIISSPDSEELLSKQGVNKQIPYQGGQRQEAAIAALDAILVEEEAREHARSVGTIPHVVGMLQDGKSGVNKLEESIGASLEIVKSSSNRLDFCRAGGVEAVLSLVDHPSSLVRRRAAACIKEVARSQELRMNLLSSNAVYGLIALCSVSEDHLTHVEAAGALLELANESSGKAALLQYQAVPVLSTLIKGERLKDADEHVIENVLAALGFMCAYPEQNHVQEVIRLSSTGYTALQDEVGKVEVMDSIVTLCKHRSFRVKNQAAAALASLCLRHTLNSRDAGRAGASQTLFELLLASEEETIQANVLKAMLSLLRAFPPNATVLKRIGAPAQLLSIRRISSFKLIRNLSELVAEHLGCWSSVDEEGNSQIMSHLSLKLAYDEQAASSPDRWSLYLVNLRACKEAFQHIVRTEEDVMRWWKLAWLDLSSFRLTDKGASGGARGNVGHRSDLHGLEKTLKQVQDLHAKFSLLSFCDVLYMAGAS
uniref:Armadillo repeat-containing domain-containing protein n=1 Tax=Guillardia theta TaxID=55529 RepID=A0A6U6BBK5_GUITH|mmetsp:Transcript_37328/g.117604  ORF Transcript_37328/g.117604 Transcript_37328/m.117604 type:complete len:636 (+) Transcript_37328:119-2026(+)